MKLKILAAATLFTSTALLMSNTVSAAQLDSSFNVKLAISSLCSINTVSDVDFGIVDTNTETQVKATEIQINCNDEKPYTVALKPSANSDDGEGEMASSDTSDKIIYNLYQDAAATVPWGTGVNAVSKTGSGVIQALPVYVKVQGSEFNKPAGQYNDVVAVSINY